MINNLLNHKSIRKYKPDEIPEHVLKQILEAGTRASTTGNMQVYSIVVSKKNIIREKLWEAHFKQKMVLEAPVVLTFCADFNRFNKWCHLRKAVPGYDNFLSFITAAIDAILAAQNVAIAAEANGMGICYLGTTTYNADSIIKILQLPKFVVPITTLVMGHPNEAPGLTDRLPLEAVVHNDVYCDYGTAEIDNFYREKENLEFTKELLKINNKETLAQIFTDLRYTKKNNETFSKSFLEVIRNQGFLHSADCI